MWNDNEHACLEADSRNMSTIWRTQKSKRKKIHKQAYTIIVTHTAVLAPFVLFGLRSGFTSLLDILHFSTVTTTRLFFPPTRFDLSLLLFTQRHLYLLPSRRHENFAKSTEALVKLGYWNKHKHTTHLLCKRSAQTHPCIRGTGATWLICECFLFCSLTIIAILVRGSYENLVGI